MRAILLASSTAALLTGTGDGAWAAVGKALMPCAGCHHLEGAQKKLAGPSLAGIYGTRPKKAALKLAKWDSASLNRFLLNPEKVDPTTRMFFKVRDQNKRTQIINSLKLLK